MCYTTTEITKHLLAEDLLFRSLPGSFPLGKNCMQPNQDTQKKDNRGIL